MPCLVVVLQRQRIAIARVMLRKPRLLFLDEESLSSFFHPPPFSPLVFLLLLLPPFLPPPTSSILFYSTCLKVLFGSALTALLAATGHFRAGLAVRPVPLPFIDRSW